MNSQLPDDVAAHLKELVASSTDEWARADDAFSRLEKLWLEKNRLFDEQIRLLGMTLENRVSSDDPRGFILLSYSGSLVGLGCAPSRFFEYASIKLRSDVPDIIRADNVEISGELVSGAAAVFSAAPVKHTSALYRIVATPADLKPSEQEKRVREAMIYLTNSFVHLNRHYITVAADTPEQFDKNAMVSFLAGRSGLTKKTVKELVDDYAVLMETGLLMGKSVPLGRLGRLSLSRRDARKARVITNPATGEEMTLPAREAHMVPTFRFSSRVKDRAAELPVFTEEDSQA